MEGDKLGRLSSKKIEELGVKELEATILRQKCLVPNFQVNDKTPFWDGEVFLYESEEESKENFRCRVSVQIKATTAKEKEKFSVKYVDLKAYEKDGGVFYFVIYLSQSGDLKSIRYASLTPVEIAYTIKTGVARKKIAVKTRRLDNQAGSLYKILLDHSSQCKMQASYIGYEFPTLDEVQSESEFENVSFTIQSNEGPSGLFEFQDFCHIQLYAKMGRSKVPLLDRIKITSVSEPVEIAFGIDGVTYFSNMERERDNEGNITLLLGKSIRIEINDETTWGIEFNSPDLMSDEYQGLSFLLGIVEKGYFEINGKKVDISVNFEERILNHFKQRFEYLKDIKIVFDKMKLTRDLDWSKVSDEETHGLYRFVQAILYDTPFPTKSGACIGRMTFGDIILLVLVHENNKGKAKLSLINQDEYAIATKTDDDELEPNSIYNVFSVRDLLEADNLDYEHIYNSVEYPYSISNTWINDLMLKCLSAYDQCDDSMKKENLYNLAYRLNERYGERSHKDLLYILNALQIKKREKELSADDTAVLLQLEKEHVGISQERFAILVLLGLSDLARKVFSEMPPEIQRNVAKYPIYRLLEDRDIT